MIREIASARWALLTSRIPMQAVASRSVISDELRSRFARAQRVLVLTGAGVSAESGVPTFRVGG